MKKWLTLTVMTCIVLGAAVWAIAKQDASVTSQAASLQKGLEQIEQMIAKYGASDELLYKRDEYLSAIAELNATVKKAEAPVSVEMQSSGQSEFVPEPVKDEAYMAAQNMGQESPELVDYYRVLLDRLDEGLDLTASEKEELLNAGLLDDQRGVGGVDPLDGTGGPDGFGYRWVDNLDGDTATYAWEDIVGVPGATLITALSGSVDDAAAAVPLSFNFPFYGVNRTTVYPSTNGAIGMTSVSSLGNTCTLPTTTFPSGGIWAFWDDQHTGRGGTGVSGTVSDSGSIWYKDEGNRIIIQWDSVGRFSPSFQHTHTYQAILYSDGKIKLQYKEIARYAPSTILPTATIGIQQGSTAPNNSFLTYSCATAGSASQDTIRNRAVWFYVNFLGHDYGCTAVIEPSPLRVAPGEVFEVIGSFRNNGTTTESSPISYRFNGGPVVTEETASLPQFGTENHDFAGAETAPMAVGDYTLTLWSNLATDGDRNNDTCRVTVQVRECYDEAQSGSFTDAGTTCGALNDWANTCMGSADAGEDYIYQWTVSQDGNYRIRYIVTSSTTLGMALSSACPPDSFNCIASANVFQDTASIECVALAAGTYFITVDRSSGCGTYTLETGPCAIGRCCYDDNGNTVCADNDIVECTALTGVWNGALSCAQNPCPAILQGSDLCADAPALAVGASASGTTVGSTPETGIPTCGSGYNSTSAGVWYQVVGNGNSLTASLCDPNTLYDSELFVFCGACTGLICVAGDDDGCTTPSLASTVTWCSANGTTYYILVTAFGTATGPYTLAVQDGAPCNNPVDCSPLGRCCYLDINGQAQCVDNLSAECSALGGTWNDALNCATTPCEIGRCCYDDNGTPACADNTLLECNALSGTWSDALDCTANPCPVSIAGGETCAEAVQITVPGSYASTTVGGVDDDPGVQCALGSADPYEGSNTAPDKWYTITGTGNTITVSLCNIGTSYDTQIAVYCGDCNNLNCVAGNDDAACSFSGVRSTASFCSNVGQLYYVVVDGWGTGNGTYELSIADDGIACGGAVDCTPLGRCCYISGGAVTCTENLATECNALGGTWTDALDCSTPCPAFGRCCYNGAGICETLCEDSVFATECATLGGTWTQDENCNVACLSTYCTCDCEGMPNNYSVHAVDETTYPIVDNSTTNITINVPGSMIVTDVNVRLDLIHTFDGDLIIVLTSPLGTIDTLSNRNGSSLENYLCTVFDDAAATPIGSGTAPFTGSYIPDQPLAAFNGENAQGNWTLSVSDAANLDAGYVVGVCLEIIPQIPCDPVVDLAAYVVTAGAPPIADHLRLHFTAPQDEDYLVYSSINPLNDGNPDAGTDPDFVLEATIPNVVAGPVVWDAPAGFFGLPLIGAPKFYVVVADCPATP